MLVYAARSRPRGMRCQWEESAPPTYPHRTHTSTLECMQVNLELNWRSDQWGMTLKKVSEEAEIIAGCGGTTATQKIKLVEMVMRPAMRYSMAVVPCTWALSFAR
eukprot:1519840-Pyramimonas_sp.AAC.1